MSEMLETPAQAERRQNSNAPHPARNALSALASAAVSILREDAMSEQPSSKQRDGYDLWPEKIYLQRHEDDVGHERFYETSWCQDKINETDIEYVRADLAGATFEPPAVLGAGCGLTPVPTGADAIEAHVREIEKLCDAANLDPAQWLVGTTQPPSDVHAKLREARERIAWAWSIIANVSGGDWSKQSQDWQDAAAQWENIGDPYEGLASRDSATVTKGIAP
jgi:hypothetical protein